MKHFSIFLAGALLATLYVPAQQQPCAKPGNDNAFLNIQDRPPVAGQSS
jgi:hypothetical protein